VGRKTRKELERLEEMAKRHGYEPGDFAMQRLADDIRTAREWEEYLKVDQLPPEFGNRRFKDARADILDLIAEIEARDKDWRDYFYPRKRAVDTTVTGADGGPTRMRVEFVSPGAKEKK